MMDLLQEQAADEKTRIFRKLFEEFECSLAQRKSKVEYDLAKLSSLKGKLGDLYPGIKQATERTLEELNNVTPGSFVFSASCN